MPNEIPQDEYRNAWQDQPVENIAMPLEEIRRRASKFERRIRWRNAREYAGVAIVVGVFGYYIKSVPFLLARAGSVLTIAGALYVAWQLHRRGSSETAPAGAALEDCLGFHRRELERQRDALASVWRWYLGPLVPGLAVFVAGTALAVPIPIGYRALTAAIMLAIVGVVFWLVAKLNRSGARKLQTRIDELQALER
jgi:small-conductance mechanosensitive channel